MLQVASSISVFEVVTPGKKRKTVQFADADTTLGDVLECAPSTEDFLRKRSGSGVVDTRTWTDLATTFGCTDAEAFDDGVMTDELLDLCSWWREEEEMYGIENADESYLIDGEDDDEDNEVAFWPPSVSQTSSQRQSCASSTSTAHNRDLLTDRNFSVRDLRFTSALRLVSTFFGADDLDSEDSNSSHAAPSSQLSAATSQPTSDYFPGCCDEMEDAYRGIVSSDNGIQLPQRKFGRSEVTSSQVAGIGASVSIDDAFAGDIDF